MSELETFLFAMGVVVPRTARSKKARQVALESWFDAHGGRPFVLSEDRAGELRRIWPDAEALAALLPEKRKALPPPDAATIERWKACGARVALPSRPLTHHDRRHKLLNHKTDAQKTAAESPEKFRQRDPASLSFESIDRRSF